MEQSKKVEFIKGLSHDFPLVIVLNNDYTDKVLKADPRPSTEAALRLALGSCIWIATGGNILGNNSFPDGLKYDGNYYGSTVPLLTIFNDFTGRLHTRVKNLDSEAYRQWREKREPLVSQFIDRSGWPISSTMEPHGALFIRPIRGMDAPETFNPDGKSIYINSAINQAIGSFPCGIGSAPIYLPVVTRTEIQLHAVFPDDPLYKTATTFNANILNNGAMRFRRQKGTQEEKVDYAAKAKEAIERIMRNGPITDNSDKAGKSKKKPKGGDAK